MRELARFYDAAEAEIAAGFLRSQGFEVGLPERHTLGAQPEMRFALGGFRLLVSDQDYFLAQNALERVQTKTGKPACPRCGQRALRRQVRWGLPFLINLFGASMGGFFPFARKSKWVKCGACGAQFDEMPDDEPEHDL